MVATVVLIEEKLGYLQLDLYRLSSQVQHFYFYFFSTKEQKNNKKEEAVLLNHSKYSLGSVP